MVTETFFFSFVKILALVGLCAKFAFVLVLPLWKFATVAPDLYTTVIILLFVAGLVFFAGRNLKNFLNGGFPTPEEQRKRIKQLLNQAGRILVILIAPECGGGWWGIKVCGGLVGHDVDEAAGDNDDLADGLAGGELEHAGQCQGGGPHDGWSCHTLHVLIQTSYQHHCRARQR